MTQKKGTKRALLLSVLALVMCCSMLIGSTYAWFTDSVTSTGNIIKSGTLKIALKYADGDLDPDSDATAWNDASDVAIFNYDKWEPGYIDAKHLKVENIGSLAFKYQMQILSNGIVTELADVIDVYFFDSAVQVTRTSFTPANRIGTLAEVLNNNFGEGDSQGANSFLAKTYGELEAGKSSMITIAFKMQESAGNEYQGLEIGTDFSIRLFATQLESENDTFDNTYDKDSLFPAQEAPKAIVKRIAPKNLGIKVEGMGDYTLDTGYQFLPTEDYDTIDGNSPYQYWHADYVVSADRDVPANSIMLAGYYKLYDQIKQLNGAWIGFTSGDEVIKAGTQIRLVELLLGESVNYDEICSLGNDGTGFLCGAKDLTGENAGTTLTVTLRLFETEAPSESNGNSHNVETGRTMDIGTFTYLFGGNYETDEAGAVYFYNDNGDIVLDDVQNVTTYNYAIKEGTTSISDGIFAWNSNITSVEIPATVTSFGSSTGAFKNSNIETAVLAEGMTAIPDFAFNQAKKLATFNIPSTVKHIGKNAFRMIAPEELTIPATVETMAEGVFRDMPNLKTVTFEGNTQISNYAFRSCKKLETVNLNGEDTTFTGTSMTFTHDDAARSEGIVINVKNTTVAKRVIVAQGAANAYAPKNYVLNINGKTLEMVGNTTALNTAITNGAKYVYLKNGTYEMNTSNSAVTFIGDSENGVKVNFTVQHSGLQVGSIWRESHFENLTFTNTVFTVMDGGNSTFTDVTFAAGFRRGYGKNVEFNNCTFGLNSENYALHFESDSSNAGGLIKINDCEFASGKIHLGGARAYAFTNCNFAENTDFQVWGNVTLTNCTVNGVEVTVDNIATFFPNLNLAKVTLN